MLYYAIYEKNEKRRSVVLLRVLGYLKRIRKDVVLSMLFIVLGQLMTLLLPLLMSMIINNGIKNADMDYIKRIGLLMILVSAVGVAISSFSSFYSSRTATSYGKILREGLFLKVETLSQVDIDTIGTPSLITRCTNDVKVMQDFILHSLRMIISAPIMLIGGTIMAFFLNAKLAMIICSVVPLLALVAFLAVKIVVPMFRKRQRMVDELNRTLREKITGIRVIRAFNKEPYEDAKFNERNEALSALVLKLQRMIAVLLPIAIVFGILALDALIYIATKNIDALTDVEKIQNTVGDLQAFVVYMIMIIFSLSMAAAMFVIVPRANISAKRIVQVLELEPAIRDPETPRSIDEAKRGEVEFRNVSFSYFDGAQPVLSEISFTAEAGKTTAIIGGTGSGKSTLINLIPRFYDADEGQVLFGGVDVRELAQDDLHSRIALVPQRSNLFSGTIEDNLRYGDENADEARLNRAVDISQAREFIDELPKGLQSFVSQNVTNLSGGQKQRLAIARALVRDADVYLFDDSFSALDFLTDAKLRAAMREEIHATVLIVAQRVGTILNADQIIVLDDGKIVGKGKHSELVQSCPIYREIVESQLSKEALK